MATESNLQVPPGSVASRSMQFTAAKGKNIQPGRKRKEGVLAEGRSIEDNASSPAAPSHELHSSSDPPPDPIQRLQMINILSASLTSSIQDRLPSSSNDSAIKSLLVDIQSSIASIHSLSGPNDVTGDFVRFSKLPIEVRRRIWMFALPSGRRVVEITYVPGSSRTNPEKPRKFTLNCDMPAMIHTCKESRKITLEKYSLLLARTDTFPRDFARIDPTTDTLYIPRGWNFPRPGQVFSQEALGGIKLLAIDDRPDPFDENFDPQPDLRRFFGLKELRINQIEPNEEGGFDEVFTGKENKDKSSREKYKPLVDIRLIDRPNTDEGYVEMVQKFLEEEMDEQMEDYGDMGQGLGVPLLKIVDVKRNMKERKSGKKYWGLLDGHLGRAFADIRMGLVVHWPGEVNCCIKSHSSRR